MIPLITKAQIGEICNLTSNIDDLDVDSFIYDAQNIDTIPVFPIALLNAIANLVDTEQWNGSASYVTGDKVFVPETGATPTTYYTALANNVGSEPPSANWEVNELMSFYIQYLVPYMAYCFYYRFIAYHGAKITPSGIVDILDTTVMQTISDKRRAEMLGDAVNKRDVFSRSISKKLNDVSFTFDDVQYLPESGKTKHVRNKVRLYALGGNHKLRGYRSIEDEC